MAHESTFIEPVQDVTMWVAEGNGSVMLKAVTAYGDPVELGENELEEVINAIELSLERLRN